MILLRFNYVNVRIEGSANEENLDESIIETIVGDEIDSGVFDQALDGANFKNEKVGMNVQELIEHKRVNYAV